MKKQTFDKLFARLHQLAPSELRQLFLRLSEEKGMLEDIFDALRDGVILFGDEGKVHFINKAATEIYKRSRAELMKVNFEQLNCGTCSWDELRESGATITRDVQINYPEQRHYKLMMSPLNKGSEYILLIQDDTESREKNAEQADAEQMDLLSFLASGVAHELGNPINSIGLNLQLIERKLRNMDSEIRHSLEPLLQSSLAETRRLDNLIHQFLQSMRPSSLLRQSVQVNQVIREVLQVLDSEISDRGISIREELSEKTPEISADDKQLFQVFYNLIRNAYQSIPGSEGVIYIQSCYNDNDVIISISDTGCGISHEVMGKLYEPFKTSKKSGNGLGLLIVRRIIKAHGGSLAIASKENTGTTITINLPRATRLTRLLAHS